MCSSNFFVGVINMYRIAICDDNKIHLDNICEKVNKYLYEENALHIVKKFNSGFDLLNEIEGLKLYDIYILDIEMPIYSGVMITNVIKKYDSEAIIIFVTSHIQYVVDSYDYNIFRFIPKNEIDQRLFSALRAAFKKINQQNSVYYYIQNNRRYEKFAYKDIIYIYKEGKNSVFVLNTHEIKERKSLNDINKVLNTEDFIFVDKCYIVNIQMIIAIDSSNANVQLKFDKSINVSKGKIKELRQKINIYWGSKI
jgi:DNA-binding LytR/AlgR family response regulator